MKTYNFLMERVYHTSLQVEAENEQEAREKVKKLDVYTIEMEQCCVVNETFALENVSEGQRFARICSVTGKGMWEGWVFDDGEFYAIDLQSADKKAQELGYKNMQEAYEEGACYWTDWAEDIEENTQYVLFNGVFYDYLGEDVTGKPFLISKAQL